jgi:response regulator NasT
MAAAVVQQAARSSGEMGDEGDGALTAAVPLALGVLMHRFSLTRGDALTRLRRTAQAEGRSLLAQADRIVQAVEDLADPQGPAGHPGSVK